MIYTEDELNHWILEIDEFRLVPYAIYVGLETSDNRRSLQRTLPKPYVSISGNKTL